MAYRKKPPVWISENDSLTGWTDDRESISFPIAVYLNDKKRPVMSYLGRYPERSAEQFHDLIGLFRKRRSGVDLSRILAYLPFDSPSDSTEISIAFFWTEGVKSVPLVLIRPERIRVTFEPKLEGERIVFIPLIYCNDEYGREVAFRDRELAVHDSKRMLLLSPERERVWMVPSTPALDRVMQAGSADLSLISGIRKTLPQNGAIILDFPYTSYSVGTPTPTPVLDISEFKHGLTLALNFNVDGGELPYNPAQPTRVLLGMGPDMTVVNLPISVQRRWFAKAESILGERIIREFNVLSTYQFSVSGSLFDLLIECGAGFLAAGFELRKKGEKIRYRNARSVALTVRKGVDWLDIQAGFETDDGSVHEFFLSDELLDNILLQGKDEYFIIDNKMLKRIRRLRLLGMQEDGRIKTHVHNPGVWEELSDREVAEGALTGIRETVLKLRDLTNIEDVETPQGFHGILRPYQSAGLSWLWFLREYGLHGCLADDMGLGKTIQTLGLLQKEFQEGSLQTALIIAPVSILSNWHREIDRFTPELTCLRHHGPSRSVDEFDSHRIILSSYATVRNDIRELLKFHFTYVILDEAQAIKNATTQTFKAVRRLKADHRLTLTGTPMENGTLELWSQMDFLLPGLLGTRREFIERFARPIEGGEADAKERTGLLRKMVYPFILRRKKEDVAPDLPEKEEISLPIEMADDQAAVYSRLRARFREEIADTVDKRGVGGSMINLLEALLRLRQAALFPELVRQEFRGISSCKFELLKDILGDIISEGNKVLIFSQFTGVLKIIRQYLAEKEIGHQYLDGSVRDRASRIEAFQEDPGVPVFLVSLKAGGLGLNLTAADYVILFDPWWNPAVERQAIDRAHRIGRTGKVIAYRLITVGTVEEKIQELQRRKSALTEELIEEDSGFLKSLNGRDIEYLFS